MGTKSCTKILNFSTRFSCENLAVEDFVTLLRPCLNVQIESVHEICRHNLSKIKLCDWPDKLDTSWQVLNTTESVGWTDSNKCFGI